jgi:hypothetical protein
MKAAVPPVPDDPARDLINPATSLADGAVADLSSEDLA